MKLVYIIAFGLVLMTTSSFARTSYPGQYATVPDDVKSWFKSVRSPHGVPCCDIADGHRTVYEIRDGKYWVPIEGEWREVPPESVITTAGNPVTKWCNDDPVECKTPGDAIVWYVRQGPDAVYIRCFVPGAGI